MSFSTFPTSQKRLLIGGVVGVVVLLIVAVILLRWRATSDLSPVDPLPVDSNQQVMMPSTDSTPASSNGSLATGTSTALTILPDSDGDGLTDQEERQLGTDPSLRDTDGDRISDIDEVEQGTDPLTAETSVTISVPTPAPIEIVTPSSTEPTVPTSTIEVSPTPDRDADTLSDQAEVAYGTDPTKSDTDGDGFSDAEEIKNGYNPLGPGRCARSDCRR